MSNQIKTRAFVILDIVSPVITSFSILVPNNRERCKVNVEIISVVVIETVTRGNINKFTNIVFVTTFKNVTVYLKMFLECWLLKSVPSDE